MSAQLLHPRARPSTYNFPHSYRNSKHIKDGDPLPRKLYLTGMTELCVSPILTVYFYHIKSISTCM